MIFKIDFEKTYDKVKWSFLQQTFKNERPSKGVNGAGVAIKANEDIGHYLQMIKWLSQRDLLLPLLFNIVANMLIVMIAHAKVDDQIEEVVPHLKDGGLSSIQ